MMPSTSAARCASWPWSPVIRPTRRPRLLEVDGQDPLAEGVARLRHDAVDVGAGVIDLGDDDHPWHGHVGALTPERPRLLVDPLVRGDDEQRAVRSPEARSHLPHEVDVPRGVQQVDLHAVVHQRREREPDGASLTVLDLLEVAHGRAVLGAAGPVQHSGRHQQPLDEGGLPRTRRAHDQDVADRLRPGRDRGAGLGGATAGLSAHRGGSRSLVRRSENCQPTVARLVPRGKGEPLGGDSRRAVSDPCPGPQGVRRRSERRSRRNRRRAAPPRRTPRRPWRCRSA